MTQTIVRRALIVGSCFAEGFSWSIGKIFPGAEADFLLFNNAGESPAPFRVGPIVPEGGSRLRPPVRL